MAMVNDAKPTRRQLQLERQKSRERFLAARKGERVFVGQLRSVARHIGDIIRAFAPRGVVTDMVRLKQVLENYSETIRPWAAAVTERMQADVSVRELKAWTDLGASMGREVRRELQHAPTGKLLREYLAGQVDLITSLPREAAERVHRLTLRALVESTRAEEIAKEILRTSHVTKSRAMLIARTEVARTASGLTMERGKFAGAEGYIWRTVLDGDVRPLHKKLEGKFFRWDDPPVTGENGERSLPGAIYNCRCWPEPVLPDVRA